MRRRLIALCAIFVVIFGDSTLTRAQDKIPPAQFQKLFGLIKTKGTASTPTAYVPDSSVILWTYNLDSIRVSASEDTTEKDSIIILSQGRVTVTLSTKKVGVLVTAADGSFGGIPSQFDEQKAKKIYSRVVALMK